MKRVQNWSFNDLYSLSLLNSIIQIFQNQYSGKETWGHTLWNQRLGGEESQTWRKGNYMHVFYWQNCLRENFELQD